MMRHSALEWVAGLWAVVVATAWFLYVQHLVPPLPEPTPSKVVPMPKRPQLQSRPAVAC